jgi:hypothetical protein
MEYNDFIKELRKLMSKLNKDEKFLASFHEYGDDEGVLIKVRENDETIFEVHYDFNIYAYDDILEDFKFDFEKELSMEVE